MKRSSASPVSTRREFFENGAAIALCLAAGKSAVVANSSRALASREFLLASGSRYGMNTKDETQTASIVDGSGAIRGQWPVPENSHQIVQSLHNPARVFSIPKEGRVVSGFDLSDPKRRREYSPPEGWRLSGHGCFLKREQLLVLAAFASGGSNPPEGRLIFLDPETLREVGQAPSGGHDPHEIAWCQAAEAIVICNSGSHASQPNISLFTPSKGRITTTWESSLHPTQSLRHLSLTPIGNCVVGSLFQITNGINQAPEHQQPVLLMLRLALEEVVPLGTWPDNSWLHGKSSLNQFLSLAYESFTDTFAATSTRGSLVTIHSRVPWVLRHAVTVPRPTGVVNHPNSGLFIVTTESEGAHLVDPISGSVTKAKDWQAQPMNSSHLSVLEDFRKRL